jgi:lipid A 4'-phosphatase
MNRTALGIALPIAVVVGVIFGVHAQFDIDISRLFFEPDTKLFRVSGHPWEQHARTAARWLITLIVAPSGVAILGKLLLPRRRMLIGGPAALFLLLTTALGPGLIANTLLKDHWGRPRPIDITEFGGSYRFTPWWNPGGPCPNNCSFIAGEPSGAFWTLAPAALAPPQWRAVAYGAALGFGAALGLLRIAAGGHFFTDVVFAGVIIYLVVWWMHGLIFRWRATRLAENAVERALAWPGETLCRAFSALARLIGRRSDERK